MHFLRRYSAGQLSLTKFRFSLPIILGLDALFINICAALVFGWDSALRLGGRGKGG